MKIRIINYFLVYLIFFPILIFFSYNDFAAKSYFSLQFHSTIEAIGGSAALFLAYLLHRQAGQRPRQYTPWVLSGLIGMGMLDLFHSMAPPGERFIWLHSSATLVGGLFFALVWLSGKVRQIRTVSLLPQIILFLSVLTGMSALFFKSTVPPMLSGDDFTIIAEGLNILGGTFFVAAAAWFLNTYRQDRKRFDAALFANFCLLLGLAGMVFPLSRLWDVEWWIWHIIRLFAYSLVFLYVSEVVLHAEENLVESEARFRTLFDQAAVGVAQIESRTGKFIQINRKYCDIIGYPPEEIKEMLFQQHSLRVFYSVVKEY